MHDDGDAPPIHLQAGGHLIGANQGLGRPWRQALICAQNVVTQQAERGVLAGDGHCGRQRRLQSGLHRLPKLLNRLMWLRLLLLLVVVVVLVLVLLLVVVVDVPLLLLRRERRRRRRSDWAGDNCVCCHLDTIPWCRPQIITWRCATPASVQSNHVLQHLQVQYHMCQQSDSLPYNHAGNC
jgi:hypothetical protein